MLRFFALEKFKEIDMGCTTQLRYAISNFGRLISFSEKMEEGRFLKGSLIEGYRIFRFKTRVEGKIERRYFLIGKLVGEYFLPKPTEEHRHLLHLDYEKANDYIENLRWATKAEMLAHHRESPYVQKLNQDRASHAIKTRQFKLSTANVMLIKKRFLNPENKTRMKMIAKQFGVSDMQIIRIKRGENWGNVEV
jgi:NUMOD4 motif